jgi:hypothetical protein
VKTRANNFKNSKAFAVDCPVAETATTYKFQADGKVTEGMDKFSYSIDQNDLKKTESVPPTGGWSASASCWTTRKDGTCG